MKDFENWCDGVGGNYETAGSDKMCIFDDWGVSIDTAHPSGGLVSISKMSDPQGTDYRALLDDVQFTEDGIEVEDRFEGDMGSHGDFEIEELRD